MVLRCLLCRTASRALHSRRVTCYASALLSMLTHICCGLAQGKYYYLPNANDAAIAMAASTAMAEAKAA